MTLPAVPLRLQPQPELPATPVERLRQALRPEFDVDVFRAVRGDPVFWPACRAEDGACQGIARLATGLCPRHTQQAYKFARSRGFERLRGERELLSPEAVALYLSEGDHDVRMSVPIPTAPTFDLSRLPDLLKRQVQYAMQRHRDLVAGEVDHRWFQRFLRRLEAAGVRDAFEMSTMPARDLVLSDRVPRNIPLGPWEVVGARDRGMEFPFIRRMLRECAPLMYVVPLEERDIWKQEDFGFVVNRGDARRSVYFHQQLPWLKEAAKRYCRYEIRVRQVDFGTVSARSRHLDGLDEYLRSLPVAPQSMSELTRDHLEGYLLWGRQRFSPSNHGTRISAVRHFLDTWREMAWEPRLADEARLRRSEGGRAGFVPTPQPLDPFVVGQLMSEEFLSKLRGDQVCMLIISRYHGLRPSSIATLPFGCLRFNDAGEERPVLRYRNEKKDRDATQPILTQVVVDAIRDQQARVLAQWPEGSPWLFPHPTGNPDGSLSRTSGSVQSLLEGILRKGLIKERDGSVAQFSWSQLRDTRATEMLNDGVHPTIVAAWLDHKDTASLEHYGSYRAETIRRAIDETPQITKHGEDLRSAYAGAEDRDVEAMRQAVKFATNTVVGGFCTLPERDGCPHMNRCFTCESFATTPGHLPELLAHLEKSDLLVMSHEAQGRKRLAEKERQNGDDARSIVRVLDAWIGEKPEDGKPIEGWLMTHRQQLERALKGREDAHGEG